MCASLLQVRPLGDVPDAGARPGPELGARGRLLGRSHRVDPQNGASRRLGSPGQARWPGGERAMGPVFLQQGRSPLRGERGAACRGHLSEDTKRRGGVRRHYSCACPHACWAAGGSRAACMHVGPRPSSDRPITRLLQCEARRLHSLPRRQRSPLPLASRCAAKPDRHGVLHHWIGFGRRAGHHSQVGGTAAAAGAACCRQPPFRAHACAVEPLITTSTPHAQMFAEAARARAALTCRHEIPLQHPAGAWRL